MRPLDQASGTYREYSLTIGRKMGQTLLAGVFLVGAGFFLKLAIDPVGRDLGLAVASISLMLGVIFIVQAWTSRLVLDQDRIEVRSLLRTRSATLAEIEGSRKIANQYGRWTRLYLKQDLGPFNVSEFYSGNDILQKWLKAIPDLDRRDADEIEKQGWPSRIPRARGPWRLQMLGLAKRWAGGLGVLAGVASIPVIFISSMPIHQASLVVLLSCPILGIVLVRLHPLLFTVFRRKPDPRADVSFLLIWPGLALIFSYQASNDPTHLVDMFQLVYWVLAVLVFLLASVFSVVWRSPSRWPALLFLVITGGMYSIGVVNSVNTLLDHSPSRPFGTWVLKKSESHSSKGTRYFLRVAPWGPITYSDDVDVPMRTYNATRVGDPVCYGLHSGFLHGPWYIAMSCSDLPARLIP